MSRPHLPEAIETQVLTLSRRRCCICFGLEGDLSRKKGQIAHLDQNSSNNDLENLAYLCLDHHDEYDSRTSQAKGLREQEVKFYRESLYAAVRQYLKPKTGTSADPDEHSEEEDVLLAKGELEFYLAQYSDYQQEGLSVLREIAEVIGRHNDEMRKSETMAEALLASPKGTRNFDGYFKDKARGMVKFATDLEDGTRRFGILTSKMLDALTRASAVASDYENASAEMFERRIQDLAALRGTLQDSLRVAGATRDEIKAWPRGTTEYNRGKRLIIATIGKYLSEVDRKIQETREQETKLQEVIELL